MIDKNNPINNYDWVYKQRVIHHKNYQKIAKLANVGFGTAERKIQEYQLNYFTDEKKCLICEDEFLVTMPNKILCSKPECHKKHAKNIYEKDKKRILQRKFQHRKKMLEKFRWQTLNYYSNGIIKCDDCGNNQYDVLEINHLDNNGSKHRRKINDSIYKWLVDNNFPSGYNVLCSNCNWKQYLKIITPKNITQHILYNFKLRIMIFQIYSDGYMNCKICEEDDIDVLTIDHINGNGNEHRKKLKNIITKPTGIPFYTWIYKNNFPDGYQVLCRNCQILDYKYNKEVKINNGKEKILV